MGIFKDSGIYKGPGIYNTGAASGGGGGGGLPIPEGYEQIESIVIRNAMYSGIAIDTSNFSNCSVETNFIVEGYDYAYPVFFAINSSSYKFVPYSVSHIEALCYNGYPIGGYYPPAINIGQCITDKLLIKAVFDNNGNLTWNGNTYAVGFPSMTSKFVLGSDYSSYSPKLTVYNLIARSNDVVVFLGLPAKRTLDEVEGILDILTGTFYPA